MSLDPNKLVRYGQCQACKGVYLWRVVRGGASYHEKTHRRARCEYDDDDDGRPLKVIRASTYLKQPTGYRRGEPHFASEEESRQASPAGCCS